MPITSAMQKSRIPHHAKNDRKPRAPAMQDTDASGIPVRLVSWGEAFKAEGPHSTKNCHSDAVNGTEKAPATASCLSGDRSCRRDKRRNNSHGLFNVKRLFAYRCDVMHRFLSIAQRSATGDYPRRQVL